MKRKGRAMNTKIYKQLDSRWSSLPYPTKKSTFGGNGCGCCACLHNMIELDEYKDWTPKDLRPYMVGQGFAIAGQGTLWSGISKTLQHYGFKVINHPTLQNIFATLDERKKKGLPCIGVILFSSGSRGGITWTAGGHFVAFVDYKVKNGKHYFYTKDSGGRDHDGWYCYETQMKGLIPQIWSALSTAKAASLPALQAAVEELKKLTVDGDGGEKTVIATQRFFKTFEDGIISGQNESLRKYYPALTAVMFAANGKSTVVKELQSWLGVTRDGVIGQETTKAWQKKLRSLGYLDKDETIDGIFGPKSMKAWQRFLNDQLFPEEGGDSRKKALTEAGHDYDAVQNRVNEILNPSKKKYTGDLRELKLIKTNAEVIADTIRWAVWIAGDNRFHYGYGKEAHHNGCYFCGTESRLKKNKGIVDYQFTFCCNPFVGAAWAHGGCVPKALELCQNCNSWDFGKGKGYDKSSLFDNLGHPGKSKLKAGDVLCSDKHAALYIGGGKIAEASGGDDNVKGSKKWNNSIHIADLTDERYKKFKRVHRFNGSVNTTCYIYHGEISKRVYLLQEYLNWYSDGKFFKECGPADGIYGDNTFKWCCRFQEEQIGKGEGDGIVGPKTIAAMEKVVK